MSEGPTKVAIACQGGGSHTAFTAGVLKGLLRDWDDDEYRLTGISGTSGGAFNAVAVWYGLLTGDEHTAIELLDALWADLTAKQPADRLTNAWLVGTVASESTGLPIPQVSPYYFPPSTWAQDRIRQTLTRHIDFDAVPDLCTDAAPDLVVGTVDVNGGVFETFTNEDVTPEAVLASAAVPNLFKGVELHGHLHWDGLFSQNPPINDLMSIDPDHKPDELWIIQINPQEVEGTPMTVDEIADRRNELSGNLSLNQELRFIQWVNEWIEEGLLPPDRFSHTSVRRIQMGQRYHFTTKLDRTPEFIAELLELGESRAQEFLQEGRSPP